MIYKKNTIGYFYKLTHPNYKFHFVKGGLMFDEPPKDLEEKGMICFGVVLQKDPRKKDRKNVRYGRRYKQFIKYHCSKCQNFEKPDSCKKLNLLISEFNCLYDLKRCVWSD